MCTPLKINYDILKCVENNLIPLIFKTIIFFEKKSQKNNLKSG
jgi:hypothetical protein